AVLSQQKDFFLFLAQIEEGLAQTIERLLVLEAVPGRVFAADEHDLIPHERAAAALPGGALQVLGGVEPDAEDPGPQVLDGGEGGAGAPALQEGVLGGVLSVVAVAEQEQQGAHQLVAQLVEGRNQRGLGGGRSVSPRGRTGCRARAEFTHGSYLYDGG